MSWRLLASVDAFCTFYRDFVHGGAIATVTSAPTAPLPAKFQRTPNSVWPSCLAKYSRSQGRGRACESALSLMKPALYVPSPLRQALGWQLGSVPGRPPSGRRESPRASSSRLPKRRYQAGLLFCRSIEDLLFDTDSTQHRFNGQKNSTLRQIQLSQKS